MKTQFDEIVDVSSIGKPSNPINQGELFKKANSENLKGSATMSEKNLLLIIDMQNDFMENGSLPVVGSHKDSENISRFIYNNIDKLFRIAVSLDTHKPFQIFHPCWWIDQKGNNPSPYTLITKADLDSGKYLPVIEPIKSRNYVENLEKSSKKTLMVWPYHCIQGTFGNALENQLSNMVYFHSIAKKSQLQTLVKGTEVLTESYGVIRPEYSETNIINLDFLNQLKDYDNIYICGEAMTHCVYETVKQITGFFANNSKVLRKINLLKDCMSPVGNASFDEAFKDLPELSMVNVVTHDIIL